MKTLLRLSLFSLLIFILWACSPKLEDEIIGTWKSTKDGDTIEFVSGGTSILTFYKGSTSKTVLGEFAFIEENRLKMVINKVPEPIIWVVSIKGDELTTTDQGDGVVKFERVIK